MNITNELSVRVRTETRQHEMGVSKWKWKKKEIERKRRRQRKGITRQCQGINCFLRVDVFVLSFICFSLECSWLFVDVAQTKGTKGKRIQRYKSFVMKKCVVTSSSLVICLISQLSHTQRERRLWVWVCVCSVSVSLAFAYACTWWWIMIISLFNLPFVKSRCYLYSLSSLSFFLWSPSTCLLYKLLTAACRLPVSNLY